MPLTGKYLKYSPDITLEIFTLVWNKLSETFKPQSNGITHDYEISFKKLKGFLHVGIGNKLAVYYDKKGLIETTVQEILGYDPFVKGEEVKQSLKQAVHCTTQEEWDFVTEKLNYKWNKFTDWTCNKEKTYISLYSTEIGNVDINSYNNQILSFQEWCDLNGYKMENEIKFEVGKWYLIQTLHSWIIKFKEIKNDKIIATWYCENKYGKKIQKGGSWEKYPINIKELSIEEIQQYLPDDHPDKIKSNQEFKVGDYIILENAGGWSYSSCNNGCLGLITKISNYKPSIVDKYICSITGDILNSKNKDTKFEDIPVAFYEGKWIVRHATPKEIKNHLISIGQAPTEKYPFKKLEEDDLTWEIKTEGIRWTESVPITKDNLEHKMILSIDDEELPMVNIIKTNTVKQLLNDD